MGAAFAAGAASWGALVAEQPAVLDWATTIDDPGRGVWVAVIDDVVPARSSFVSDDQHEWLHVVGIGPAGAVRYERRRYRPW